jgi:hypothetical protein
MRSPLPPNLARRSPHRRPPFRSSYSEGVDRSDVSEQPIAFTSFPSGARQPGSGPVHSAYCSAITVTNDGSIYSTLLPHEPSLRPPFASQNQRPKSNAFISAIMVKAVLTIRLQPLQVY